jgi:hypothetical protein
MVLAPPSSTDAPGSSPLLPVLEQPANKSADRAMTNQADVLSFI